MPTPSWSTTTPSGCSTGSPPGARRRRRASGFAAIRRSALVGLVAVVAAHAAEAPPLMDGLGTHHFPVTTRSPQAQAYMDQGIAFVYGFNHDEAIRAFEEAARLDPSCAMAYWGKALALGPNYNVPIDSERAVTARKTVERALALSGGVSARERAYIHALAKRYGSRPSTADRKALDRAYANAMREVARRYPDDLDASVLFAESLMVLRPWDLWTADGKPQPGTEEIVATLERVMARAPGHPGANHYYIHAVEASPNPERALRAADTVAATMPAAGHIVHMPSHIYMRIGRYADAADTNTNAIKVDEAYIASQKPAGVYPMMYYPHNVHFFWSAASMEGRSADALAAAQSLDKQIEPAMLHQMPTMEYFAPTLELAYVRFAKWDEILALPKPPDDLPYSVGMWEHARGLALVAKGRVGEAEAAHAELVRIAAATPADRIVADNQPAAQHLRLAADVLGAEIAARRGRTDDAVRTFEDAVRLEDTLPYTEPPAWYQPVRHRLGALLLRAGRPADAEAVYREDLRRNPDNLWALTGLAETLRRRGQRDEAAATDERLHRASARADVRLKESVL
jgi:tetratricopeptide (TPR) repeat protein